MNLRLLPWLCLPLLAACAGSPPPPDWKMNAVSLLETYQRRWLEGDSKTAELTFSRARSELAKTGRLDLAARAELIRCAAQVASLDFQPCSAYEKLAADAAAEETAYAHFLTASWQGLNPDLLPRHYADLVKAKDAAQRNRVAQTIDDPAAQLIASALLLKTGEVTPETIGTAQATASERGWRRPLLAWLEISAKRAEAAGDQAALTKLQRQIELVLSAKPVLPMKP